MDRRISLCSICITNNFKRWITRLARRWRMQQNVWINVNCTTLWSLTIWTQMAAMGQPVATSVWGSVWNLSLRSIVVFWKFTFPPKSYFSRWQYRHYYYYYCYYCCCCFIHTCMYVVTNENNNNFVDDTSLWRTGRAVW
jgi:hypothetical protein